MTPPPPPPTLRTIPSLLRALLADKLPLVDDSIALALKVGIVDRAAALTLFSVLAAVPTLLAGFAALGYVLAAVEDTARATGIADVRVRTIAQITAWIRHALPGVTWNPADFAAAMVRHRTTHGVIGFFAALWLGLGYFGRIDDAIRDLFGRRRRASVRAAGVMALMGVMATVLALVINLVGPLLEWGLTVATGAVKTLSFGWLDTKGTVVAMAQSLPVALVFYLMVRWSARLKLRRRALAIALVFGLVWAGGQRLFTLYVKTVVRMDAVYGALSGVLALLLWLFYANVLFLACVAVLASWDRRSPAVERRGP